MLPITDAQCPCNFMQYHRELTLWGYIALAAVVIGGLLAIIVHCFKRG